MLDSLSNIFASLWREVIIMFLFYALQLAMVLADLFAGLAKAKRAGVPITSRRLRDSVDKLCRYYALTLMASILDVVLIVAVKHYNDVAGVEWPVFPILTILATVGVGLIEIVSMWEKLDRKTKARTQDAAAALAYIIKHADDAEGLVALAERLRDSRKGKDGGEEAAAEANG